jgi:hypothetical protein
MDKLITQQPKVNCNDPPMNTVSNIPVLDKALALHAVDWQW